jgi:hypothetical protein
MHHVAQVEYGAPALVLLVVDVVLPSRRRNETSEGKERGREGGREGRREGTRGGGKRR